MTNLTANKPRKFHGPSGPILTWPMPANTQLFHGAALMREAASGNVNNCTPTASGQFVGFADSPVDNRTGSEYGGAAQAAYMPVVMKGCVWLTVANGSNWAVTDTNATVYASDGDTFTTSAGTNNIVVGKVVFIPPSVIGAASGEILVAFEAAPLRSI